MSDDLLQDKAELSLDEVCVSCNLAREVVTSYIEEGLLEVEGATTQGWRFSQTQVVYIQKATRLQNDLRLNVAGSVLVLELLEQIDELKNRLQRFERG